MVFAMVRTIPRTNFAEFIESFSIRGRESVCGQFANHLVFPRLEQVKIKPDLHSQPLYAFEKKPADPALFFPDGQFPDRADRSIGQKSATAPMTAGLQKEIGRLDVLHDSAANYCVERFAKGWNFPGIKIAIVGIRQFLNKIRGLISASRRKKVADVLGTGPHIQNRFKWTDVGCDNLVAFRPFGHFLGRLFPALEVWRFGIHSMRGDA
jgi:hypothetical protein